MAPMSAAQKATASTRMPDRMHAHLAMCPLRADWYRMKASYETAIENRNGVIRNTARDPMPSGMNGVDSTCAMAAVSTWPMAAAAVSGIPIAMIDTWKKSAATTPHMPLITFDRKMTPPTMSTADWKLMPTLPDSTAPDAIICAAKMPSRLGMFDSHAHIRTPRCSP